MKDFYKNKYFYFILAPVLAGVWTATASMVSLPTAESQFERKVDDWSKSKDYINQILALDMARLKYKDNNDGGTNAFKFGNVIAASTDKYKISESGYSLREGTIVPKGKKKIRSADMTIDNIDILTFSEFSTSLQDRWPNLKVDTLKMTNLKDSKDSWKFILKLTYTY